MASKAISTALVLALLCGGLAVSTALAGNEGSAVIVKLGHSQKLGRFLVDSRGHTLYLYTPETASAIQCTTDYLNCAGLWPPLLTSAKPRAGAGVNGRLLGTVRRTHPAGVQVTYNRHPLYLYSPDVKAGMTSGQGLFKYWYVVSPAGKAIKK